MVMKTKKEFMDVFYAYQGHKGYLNTEWFNAYINASLNSISNDPFVKQDLISNGYGHVYNMMFNFYEKLKMAGVVTADKNIHLLISSDVKIISGIDIDKIEPIIIKNNYSFTEYYLNSY